MILFCGDPHGKFDHIIQHVQQTKPAAVIILGDLCLSQPFDQTFSSILTLTDIWFIHGNHDTDEVRYYDNLFSCSDHNLHGRVIEVDGLKIAGLGGIFRKQIWYPPELPKYSTKQEFITKCGKGNHWRNGLPRKHRSSIFPEDIKLFDGLKADILVCHEAPQDHPYGFHAIDDLANCLGVSKVIHGHHHDAFIYDSDRYQNVGLTSLLELVPIID
ncbi:metallophosphoesterase family protein [Aeromonas caviae]|uniref:metallophosphoesterase family protein n=1 Tax=Aeromonas caviae TaxID=648 RepID=UPI000F5D8CBD|nr:metallophosphoesterase [Aeromonas caviae]MDX7680044.1 metallophosphoesterase [Aeromonas caviae]MDX7887410.1 metallophosphoesterase [Aeromonas caviae]RQX28015.1 metallophosphoesterase [Aeromonas caviae]